MTLLINIEPKFIPMYVLFSIFIGWLAYEVIKFIIFLIKGDYKKLIKPKNKKLS